MKDVTLPDYEHVAFEILNAVTDCFTSQKGGEAKSKIISRLQELYNKGFVDGKVHMLNCMESNIKKEEGNR